MIDAQTLRQFVRYATVGVVSNLTLYIAYLGVTGLGMGHKLAMTLLYVTGVIVTFVFNRNWTFGHDGFAHQAFARYVIAYLLGYLLNLGLLWIGVDYLNLPHQGVQAGAIIVVASCVFLIHKYWVFEAPAIRGRSL